LDTFHWQLPSASLEAKVVVGCTVCRVLVEAGCPKYTRNERKLAKWERAAGRQERLRQRQQLRQQAQPGGEVGGAELARREAQALAAAEELLRLALVAMLLYK
jgi:hypothetical protein